MSETQWWSLMFEERTLLFRDNAVKHFRNNRSKDDRATIIEVRRLYVFWNRKNSGVHPWRWEIKLLESGNKKTEKYIEPNSEEHTFGLMDGILSGPRSLETLRFERTWMGVLVSKSEEKGNTGNGKRAKNRDWQREWGLRQIGRKNRRFCQVSRRSESQGNCEWHGIWKDRNYGIMPSQGTKTISCMWRMGLIVQLRDVQSKLQPSAWQTGTCSWFVRNNFEKFRWLVRPFFNQTSWLCALLSNSGDSGLPGLKEWGMSRCVLKNSLSEIRNKHRNAR